MMAVYIFCIRILLITQLLHHLDYGISSSCEPAPVHSNQVILKSKNEFYLICPNHMNMRHLESPVFVPAHVHSNQVILQSKTRVSFYLSESHEHAHIILAYVDLAWLFRQRNTSSKDMTLSLREFESGALKSSDEYPQQTIALRSTDLI